jgi:hypothetical protein
MMARLEIGEVLLTASIGKIEVQVVLGVMPGNIAARDKVGESITRRTGQFAGFAKRQDALRIEGDGKFTPESGFDLGYGEPQAACHGFGNVEMKGHRMPGQLS